MFSDWEAYGLKKHGLTRSGCSLCMEINQVLRNRSGVIVADIPVLP